MQNVIDINSNHANLSNYIRYALQCHEIISIGSNDVDTLHDRVKAMFPEAKLTKCEGYLLVENK